MLLLKKKKYAALVVSEGPGGVVSTTREMKGLDMVRRDWCVLSRELGTSVLDVILSGKERDEIVDAIHTMLAAVAGDMRAGSVPIDKYVITKGLNKAPGDYPDVKGQPHLQVALSLIKAGRAVNVGDHIPYIICCEPVGTAGAAAAGAEGPVSPSGDGATSPGAAEGAGASAAAPPRAPSSVGPAMRAYHPDEVRKGVAAGTLHIDVEWYLTQQVLPPVARVCEPIAGTSQQRLASCLGLDASRFAGRTGGASGLGRDDEGSGFVPRYVSSAEDRFAGVDRLLTGCTRCGHIAPFPGVFALVKGPAAAGAGAGAVPGAAGGASLVSGLTCTAGGCTEGLLLPVALPAGTASTSDAAIAYASVPAVPSGADALDFCRVQLLEAVDAKARAAILLHQQGEAFCDDPVCPYYSHGTRALSTRKDGFACPRPGCRGLIAPGYSHGKLHVQLEYLASLFGVERERRKRRAAADAAAAALSKGVTAGWEDVPSRVPELRKEHVVVFNAVEALAERYLRQSAYQYVSPGLFSYVAQVNVALKRQRAAADGPAAGAGAAAKRARNVE
jgi:DNA polymerase alpha subunit A